MQSSQLKYHIYRLSEKSFQKYSAISNSEVLLKRERPYNCLLIKTKFDYFICIPYRTEIRHKEAFFFKKSQRAQTHKSGLDYSKIVIIDDLSYIDQSPVIIDKDEFTETRLNIGKIAQQASSYIDTYVNHCNGTKVISKATFLRKYKYSTLKNFHKELGIEK